MENKVFKSDINGIYREIEKAFDFFNERLFDNELCEVVFTLNGLHRIKGFYHYRRFVDGEKKGFYKDEISLNPLYFGLESKEEVLATLVHEMCHLYMMQKGEVSCNGYHSKKWSDRMIGMGLMPTDTGFEGGKTYGYKITQYIVKGGRFESLCRELFDMGFHFTVCDSLSFRNIDENVKETKSKGLKIKYSCGCSKVWGKDRLKLICGKCHKEFVRYEK